MTPKEIHKLLDSEISAARSGKKKPDRTNATIRAVNAKLSVARLQFQVWRYTGQPQDLGGLVSVKPPIEGKVTRVAPKALAMK